MSIKIKHICDRCGSLTEWRIGEEITVGKITVRLSINESDVCEDCRPFFLRDVADASRLKVLG